MSTLPGGARRQPRFILAIAAILALAAGFLLPGAAEEAPRTDDVLFFEYAIDRSSVPDWVDYLELTLVVDVSGAEAVRAWDEHGAVAVEWEAGNSEAIITTDADLLTIAMQGTSLGDTVGEHRFADLKDDKSWAYSLTFDDGEYSVYQNALPELERYGYRAGVAVIGRWLDSDDAVENGYASAVELLELLDKGWSVFNHSYSHYDGEADVTPTEIERCQTAIYEHLNGYEADVFTAPFTNSLWEQVVDDYGQELGIHLLQLVADDGERIKVVEGALDVEDSVFHLGRRDVKLWVDDIYNYFDQAHLLATDEEPARSWVSLHAHNIEYDEDWCEVAASSAYLYHNYGGGGTDEVWVAPADEVLDYWVVRSYSDVTVSEGTERTLGEVYPATTKIVYRQGVNDYAGWEDTSIQEWYPTENYGAGQNMLVRGGSGRASALIKAPIDAPDDQAIVQRAVLSVYASSHTNDADSDLMAHRMLRDWDEATATWSEAEEGLCWDTAGALGMDEDRLSESTRVHVGGCAKAARWYHIDVTEMVSYWLLHPDENLGLIVSSADDVSKGSYLVSADYYDVSLRPYLSVDYAWPSPYVEPTSTPSPTPTQTTTATPTPSATPTPFLRSVDLPLVWGSVP